MTQLLREQNERLPRHTYWIDVRLNSKVEETLLEDLDELAGFNDGLLAQRLIVQSTFMPKGEAAVMET